MFPSFPARISDMRSRFSALFKLHQNVKEMGRKRVHGGQFSRLNQPSVKKKEITNENMKK